MSQGHLDLLALQVFLEHSVVTCHQYLGIEDFRERRGLQGPLVFLVLKDHLDHQDWGATVAQDTDLKKLKTTCKVLPSEALLAPLVLLDPRAPLG